MSRWSQKRTKIAIAVAIVVVLGVTVGFAAWEYGRPRLILATTTSTYDSGLLDYLLPEFENKYFVKVDIVSVGTGQAIATAQSGDADVLLVHARASEDQFVKDGYGVHRVCVMYNDFVILGPSSDPAGILGQTSATTAFKKVAAAGESGKAVFISRGDNSGTNKKEMEIWAKTGINPEGKSWYKETGQGMGDTLTVTDQQQAYTLADRGTWLSKKNTLGLVILSEGDQILLNPYGMILINPEKYPDLNHQMASNLISFMVSEHGQQKIASFTVGGEVLFKTLYGKCASITGCPTQSQELAYWGPISGNFGTSTAALCEVHECCHCH